MKTVGVKHTIYHIYQRLQGTIRERDNIVINIKVSGLFLIHRPPYLATEFLILQEKLPEH